MPEALSMATKTTISSSMPPLCSTTTLCVQVAEAETPPSSSNCKTFDFEALFYRVVPPGPPHWTALVLLVFEPNDTPSLTSCVCAKTN